MAVTIYGLTDPETQELRYVGQTKSALRRRLAGHLAESHTKSHLRAQWIKGLRKRDLRPQIFIIEQVNGDQWREAEPFWIEYFRSLGCRLTNMNPGGEDGVLLTDEVRRKISDSSRQRRFSPESRAKISRALKGRKKPTGHGARVSRAMSGRAKSPEHRAALSRSRRGTKNPKVTGSLNPRSKLDEARVFEARRAHMAGESVTGLARRFGVHKEVMRMALNGKTWKHVPRP